MKLQELINILGKPINDPTIISFLKKYNYKNPKKDKITNQSSSEYYWIESQKFGVNILYKINILNELYPNVSSGRKGSFYPRICQIDINENASVKDLPVNFSDGFEDLVTKFGMYYLKSSEIAYIWLEDGQESFYDWKILIDKDKQIHLSIRYSKDQIENISLQIDENESLIRFYYESDNETYESYLEESDYSQIAEKKFLRWLIENDYINSTDTVENYIKSLNRGYFGVNDLTKDKFKIRRYVNNLNRDDIYLISDFENTFLNKPDLSIIEQENFLNSIEYNEKNYQLMKETWDKRLI